LSHNRHTSVEILYNVSSLPDGNKITLIHFE